MDQTVILQLARQAKQATLDAANLTTQQKNAFLKKAAELLRENISSIVAENQKDLAAGKQKGLSSAMLDRLMLDDKRIHEMAKALEEIIHLPDPVGDVVKEWTRPNGLKVKRVRIPLGVILIIYESRPNVTVDAAALCFKSGNVVILRGGSEAYHSNQKLVNILKESLQTQKLNPDMIQFVPTTDRESLYYLMTLASEIDLIIPRGGPSLMQMIREHAKIPVIRHDKGVCHLYIDAEADLAKAEKICINSKVQRPGVCNALETLLVDEKLKDSFLPKILEKLQSLKVEIRGDDIVQKVGKNIKPATDADWDTEYLDLILSVKVVKGLEGALDHIHRYSSLHTEAIVTENKAKAERFIRDLNSSAIMWNASTRFNDGGQLGLGAEIGISTTKLHAFGPMGLEELTTTKFVVIGNGQIRE
ncbi:MAG: glutamate-5-semialdehyde dehydrogenase [Deltaproteobacteria bacterium]|nr:glutamate-5-semialdehyde dehydrogenase [Deltaproteobacteria bacterium]